MGLTQNSDSRIAGSKMRKHTKYKKNSESLCNCFKNIVKNSMGLFKKTESLFKKTDTKQQFIILFVFSTLVLIATVCIISSAYSKTILDSNEKYINNVVKQYKNEFSHNLSQIDQLVNGLAFNPAVKNYLTIEDDPYKRHLYASELVTYFYKLKSIKPAIKDISVFRLDMGKVTYYNLIKPESFIFKIFDQKPYSYCYGVADYEGKFGGISDNSVSVLKRLYKGNDDRWYENIMYSKKNIRK
jgi:hypothetical protein